MHPVFNAVAPYRWQFPTVYFFMADIANPDLFVCSCRTWFCLDITRFYEGQRQPSSRSAWPACPKTVNLAPIAGGTRFWHNLQSNLQTSWQLHRQYAVLFGALSSVNMNIRKINSIRRYLSNTAVRTLVQSIVIARLDYCNNVCIGLPMNRLQSLQLIQNSAARVISLTKRYTSITPILDELHWLAINKHCQFKILILTFKSLNGCAPEYLCDMLNVYMPNRSLRSAAFTSLI